LTQCVILAGGLGTRMDRWTTQIPKAMIPVAGRPFADLQLELLAFQGVTDVVYSVGYLGSLIRDHVGDGARFGLRVRYVDEGSVLRGTGGALRLAADEGALDERFLVIYGDSYLPIDVGPVVASFVPPALMVVYENGDRFDRSNVVFEDGRVVLYDKRAEPAPPSMTFVDYGLSMFTRRVILERVPPGEVVDLADVCHRLSIEGLLAGFEVTERFYEIGSPDGLQQLEALVAARSG
jgi:NDP-sugar pyrophosphorylase family protein